MEIFGEKEKTSLGDRIKGYESIFTGPRIDPSKPFVMRFDGHGFSKFTRGLHKPYDYNFHLAMSNTAMILMQEFHADTAYTHSDEISLLFYPKRNRADTAWQEPHFGGRIQKIISIGAGYCSVVFNKQLVNIFADKKDQYVTETQDNTHVHDRMMNSQAYFDCRIFQMPNNVEMFSYMFWRSKVDCMRNHVSELARKHYSKKELDGKSTSERIDMLGDKGISWDDQPRCFRYGSFFKRVPRPTETGAVRYDFKEVQVNLVKFNDAIDKILSCVVYSLPT